MSGNKTQPTTISVESYLSTIADQTMRSDSTELVKIMEKATGEKAVMWGSAIVGFGTYHYVYESGREGDICTVGFAARKSGLVLYGVMQYEENQKNRELIQKLGSYSLGKGCMYLKKLADVDKDILSRMITNAYNSRAK